MAGDVADQKVVARRKGSPIATGLVADIERAILIQRNRETEQLHTIRRMARSLSLAKFVAATIIVFVAWLAPAHFDRGEASAPATTTAIVSTAIAQAFGSPSFDWQCASNSGYHDCARPCYSHCVQSGGSGCCASGILANRSSSLAVIAREQAPFEASDRGIAGIDPRAPQEPPRNLG